MSMEQHPIPQNISSYEFRLVGDMTLKQFLQLAGGIIVGVIIYRLPLPAIVRYPLVFLAVVIGIALAFVPINGRPFARYIYAFITAIYVPTEFAWRQEEKAPSPVPLPPTSPLTPAVAGPIIDESKIASNTPLIVSASTQTESKSEPTQTTESIIESTLSIPSPQPTSEPIIPTDMPTQQVVTPGSDSDQTIFSSTENVFVQTPNQLVVNLPKKSAVDQGVLASITKLIQAPTQPNILAGIVATSEGNMIENAIVEIIDSKTGIPARALRSNRTGQFQIGSPLTSGSYTIQTEKDGATFAPVHIEVTNKIIDPIIITSV